MIYHELSCFSGFRCIAGACPDTCCAGWEIDLDHRAIDRYARMPGPLGEELREAMTREGEYTFFALRQGRCPFLSGENLCRLILGAGEACLSETCRSHPRFWADFGDLRETALGISCPEAARLLLTEPLQMVETADGVPGDPDPELDRRLLRLLLEMRGKLLDLCLEPLPLSARMGAVLETARVYDGLLLRWDAGERVTVPEPVISETLLLPEMPAFLRALGEMELTDGRLPELLARRREQDPDAPGDPGGRLLYYFLYRYALRGVWDGWLYEKLAFSVYAAAVILSLPGDLTASAAVFCRETEHSEENLTALFRALRLG